MYFSSRVEAGKMLAAELEKYQGANCAVVALSDGGVVVGAEIAQALHCVLMMLLTEPIAVPGEPEPVAVINQEGDFTYNSLYSTGELEELDMDYHHYIEESKLEKLHRIHHLLGKRGLLEKDLVSNHTIILVSDGLSSGFSLDAAVDYLKTIKVKQIIAVAPVATIRAVDHMHILADDIRCLSVIEDYISTDHYYEDNTIPDHAQIVQLIANIVEAAEGEQAEAKSGRQSAKKPKPKAPTKGGGLLSVPHSDTAPEPYVPKNPGDLVTNEAQKRPGVHFVPQKPRTKPDDNQGLLEIPHK
jgi:putative phosphoribosyl transferase